MTSSTPRSLRVSGHPAKRQPLPNQPRAFNLAPGAGPTIHGPAGRPLTFKLRGHQTGGRLTAIENVIPPGEGPPLHAHANEDEAWYVLEGQLRFKLDSEISTAPAGSFVFAPRGTAHCFVNTGTQPARILFCSHPRGWRDSLNGSPRFRADDASRCLRRDRREVNMQVVGPPLAQSDRQ